MLRHQTCASDGINKTKCKHKTPITNASHVNLFENIPILKIDSFERELKPCINLDKHNVVNAMVVAVSVSPVCNPMRKATIVANAINKPSSITCVVNFLLHN